MARTRSILHIRDSSSLQFTYRRNNPGTGLYFDNVAITACTVEVRNTDTGSVILAATTMTYSAVRDGYFLSWAYAALLDGARSITVRFVPTRAATTPAALAPSATEDYDLSDIEKRVGDMDVQMDTYEANAVARQAVNIAEHDQTQSQISTIGAAAESQLIGPTSFDIPDSGSKTFILEFVLKDLDTSPVALIDPDSNQVDVAVIDQAGVAPTGVTLGGSPTGRMTRNSAGLYQLEATVSSTALDDTQLRFTAAYSRSAVANIAKWNTMLGDFDQLDTIQAQVDAIRSVDVPALTAEHDATQALLEHASFGLAALKTILDALNTKLGTNADAAGTTTVFARLRQIVETYLADATFGLAALDADLNLLLARLGITTDTGGTVTTGTVMAKLNKVLGNMDSAPLTVELKP